MTDDELQGLAPEVRESIEAAHAATAAAKQQHQQVQETRRQMTPVWGRLNRVEDTWGAELEAALALRGTP